LWSIPDAWNDASLSIRAYGNGSVFPDRFSVDGILFAVVPEPGGLSLAAAFFTCTALAMSGRFRLTYSISADRLPSRSS
jgi:hypothetical protein